MTTSNILNAVIPLVADLSRDLPERERLRRLLAALRQLLPADAVATWVQTWVRPTANLRAAEFPHEVEVAQLRRVERLQQAVRGDLVVSFYNQKELWPHFGYEGESYSKGGYIARGFDDIEWL